MNAKMKAFIDRVDAALWLIVRRWTMRQLRKLVDVADDRLHAAEVSFRKEQELRNEIVPARVPAAGCNIGSSESPLRGMDGSAAPVRKTETYVQWEARRSGIAPISKKAARQHRQRMTAAAFDVKYAG
jgi:hypothetical protein